MVKKTMTPQEVCWYLGPEESIERFLPTGQIPFNKTPERIRFDKAAIDALGYWLDCHSIEI